MRILGAVLVIAASAFVGFGFAAAVRRQCRQQEALLSALELMKNEMQYRMTPLEDVFAMLRNVRESAVAELFEHWSENLYGTQLMSVEAALQRAVEQTHELNLPPESLQTLRSLSQSLGKLDADGQCSAIQLSQTQLQNQLAIARAGSEKRAQSYRTVGVCAGLALAVILL